MSPTGVDITWAGPAEFQFPLSDAEVRSWKSLPALHQPGWGDEWLVAEIRRDLAGMPPLVDCAEVGELHTLLAQVVAGQARVVQAGDCAEDPGDCVPGVLARKVG